MFFNQINQVALLSSFELILIMVHVESFWIPQTPFFLKNYILIFVVHKTFKTMHAFIELGSMTKPYL